MQIGFFDSGVGGITVLHEALKILPDEDYIYYADTHNVPYGAKPKEEVKEYVFTAIEFMIHQGVKAIVIACNTATSVAIGEVRSRYKVPVIGMEPAVKPAVQNNQDRNKRVLVTATALTLKEEKLQNLIAKLDQGHIVDLLPLPGLVQFAEKQVFHEETVLQYLKEQLSAYDLDQYGTVVLGCTHFPYYKNLFREILPKQVSVIDGNKGTVNNLKRTLEDSHTLSVGSGKIVYYESGIKVDDSIKLNKYKELMNRLNHINGVLD